MDPDTQSWLTIAIPPWSSSRRVMRGHEALTAHTADFRLKYPGIPEGFWNSNGFGQKRAFLLMSPIVHDWIDGF